MNDKNNNSLEPQNAHDTATYSAIKRLAIPESMMPVKDIPELLVENRRVCMEMAKQVMQQMAMLATYFGVPLMEVTPPNEEQVRAEFSAPLSPDQDEMYRTLLDLD